MSVPLNDKEESAGCSTTHGCRTQLTKGGCWSGVAVERADKAAAVAATLGVVCVKEQQQASKEKKQGCVSTAWVRMIADTRRQQQRHHDTTSAPMRTYTPAGTPTLP